MNFLRGDKIYFAHDILPALMKAGQFPHVTRAEFEGLLEEIYTDGTWRSLRSKTSGYMGSQEHEISQFTLIRAFRSKKMNQRAFDPYYVANLATSKFKCVCVVCAGNAYYGNGLWGMQYAICPSALFISDKHGRAKEPIGGSLCNSCCKLMTNRALKLFSIKKVYEDETVPEQIWIEILAKIHKTPGAERRIKENAARWSTFRFDPRRTAPA